MAASNAPRYDIEDTIHISKTSFRRGQHISQDPGEGDTSTGKRAFDNEDSGVVGGQKRRRLDSPERGDGRTERNTYPEYASNRIYDSYVPEPY
jgi:hypothetical protein